MRPDFDDFAPDDQKRQVRRKQSEGSEDARAEGAMRLLRDG
jgi:hypothetical protein